MSSSAAVLTGWGVPVRSIVKSGTPSASARVRASSVYPASEKNAQATAVSSASVIALSQRHSMSRGAVRRREGSTWATIPRAVIRTPDGARSAALRVLRYPSHRR
ncbi:hypothetical protein CP970_08435 [Streptomyces kanamyceticus]|uniref:Uncharacterized protein n=1 Tax=Streptomyces kanamyceticus TaxID=1967 RepID=A0A5J6GAR2_STRKN|nr:hypothetical protein CP970_08435 [Streptomyces kanamyceticus]